MNDSPEKTSENGEYAVVKPRAVCVFSAPGQSPHRGEIVTVDGNPMSYFALTEATFVPEGEPLDPGFIDIIPGTKIRVEIRDETSRVVLGHVEQVVQVPFAPQANVTSLEADPARPHGPHDSITKSARIHQLTAAPLPQTSDGDHPVPPGTGATKR